MSAGQSRAIYRQVQMLYEAGTSVGLTDAQLLDRFVNGRGAEAAFEALVARHGPMVLGICRDVLHDPHAAEDAFQATFLVLARKSRSIWVRDSLGRWLSGVARRVARRARGRSLRQRAREETGSEFEPAIIPDNLAERAEVRAVVREELDRLPDRFREPILLCHLEGLTHEQAADRLRWPVGTVRSRLSRGRDKLRGRLERRGLAPMVAGPLGVTLAAKSVKAAVPLALRRGTVRAALAFAAGSGGATIGGGTVPLAVGALANGVIMTMWTTKLAMIGVTVLTGGLMAGGAGALAYQDGEGHGRPTPAARSPVAQAPAANPADAQTGDEKPGDVINRALRAFHPDLASEPPSSDTSLRELGAQLRAALRLFTLAESTPRERAEAEGLVEILKARIEDRRETLVRELEVLKQQLQVRENELAQAQLEQPEAAERVAWSKRMANIGYITPAQHAADRADLEIKTANVPARQALVDEVRARIAQAEQAIATLDEMIRNIAVGQLMHNDLRSASARPPGSTARGGGPARQLVPGGDVPQPPRPPSADPVAAKFRGDRAVSIAYPVGDLVFAFNPEGPPTSVPSRYLDNVSEMVGSRRLHRGDFEPLIELIRTEVAPGTWRADDAYPDSAEEMGSITPFFLNISLIIRHTPETHDEVVEVLRLLRRWHQLNQADSDEAIEGHSSTVDGAGSPATAVPPPIKELLVREIDPIGPKILDSSSEPGFFDPLVPVSR